MHDNEDFPTAILLHQSERRQRLLQEFYESHHRQHRNCNVAKQSERKLAFFSRKLTELHANITLGIDLGCRGGALTQHLGQYGHWLGVDIDTTAIGLAKEKGIPCLQSDISIALDFHDEVFDGVVLTEVLEHLPYPSITIREIYRILKKQENSVFLGSVPVDYNLSRRFSVLFGQRLTKDPTHLHNFSFHELQALLHRYFHEVEFEPLRGTATCCRWLPWQYFVKDIAWFARSPKQEGETITA